MYASAVAAVAVCFLAIVSRAGAAEEAADVTKPYQAPGVDGLHVAETFDGDVWSRWSQSSSEKYNGKFTVAQRRKEALVGDLGLLVEEEAKHYGAATTFAPLQGQTEVPFVAQFEVRFQDHLSCGGSYIKLFDAEGKQASDFNSDTPYVIMFGPDKCGATDKVHFILRHRSPKTGEIEEKHFKEAPHIPMDTLSHLYTLIIKPDNSFEIEIDGVKKASGNLLTSMEPPVNPPKEIDDPADSKPEDWVDEARIDDPESSKPEDWDEDAPASIVDPKASMPAGWVEDAEKKIADPAAKRPEDWDDEEDGDWEAPTIDNPVCKVGCGKWVPPTISNPAYKGKWHAPKIDNPDYKGIWKAKQIPNPNYFFDENPYVLPTISGVGIDIWTMSKGILFDNIVLGSDPTKAKEFADQSWKIRKEIEELQKPSKGTFDSIIDKVSKNAVPIGITVALVLISTILLCCCTGGDVPKRAEPKAQKKKATKEEAQKESDQKKEKDKMVESEDTKGESDKKKSESEDKKEDGGLGDLDGAES